MCIFVAGATLWIEIGIGIISMAVTALQIGMSAPHKRMDFAQRAYILWACQRKCRNQKKHENAGNIFVDQTQPWDHALGG
jgi:hypothetical protein